MTTAAPVPLLTRYAVNVGVETLFIIWQGWFLKVNHDGNLKRLERIRDQANERVTLANDAARKAATRLSKKTLDRIRKKRGEQARERDRPDYSKMNPHKVLAARVFHQLYELTVKQRKRAIDVFRDFDTDDSGTATGKSP